MINEIQNTAPDAGAGMSQGYTKVPRRRAGEIKGVTPPPNPGDKRWCLNFTVMSAHEPARWMSWFFSRCHLRAPEEKLGAKLLLRILSGEAPHHFINDQGTERTVP